MFIPFSAPLFTFLPGWTEKAGLLACEIWIPTHPGLPKHACTHTRATRNSLRLLTLS